MNFDLNEELKKLNYPNMFKNGLKQYIINKNKNIKNKKELEKIIEEYGKVKM